MKRTILFSLVMLLVGICYGASEKSLCRAAMNFSVDAPLAKVSQSQIAAAIRLGTRFVPDEIIIGFSPSMKTILGRDQIKAKNGEVPVLNEQSLDEIASEFGVSEYEPLFPGHPTKLQRIYRVKLAECSDITSAIAAYDKNPQVEFAEPSLIYDLCIIPSDEDYSEQWSLEKINCPKAWDITTGDTDVVIAIVDTGIDWDHPDLANNIWTNSGDIPDNLLDDDDNGFVDDYRGWDFVSVAASEVYLGEDPEPRDKNPMDFHGHGTHCAGIAGAVANNDTGLSHNVVGVAWNCKIMAVRAGYKGTDGKGHLISADWAAAVIYAADNGADIISMSFGSYSSSSIGLNATNYASSEGCVLVAAAGNDNSQSEFYPACNPDVLSVAASDSSDRKAWFSNFGSWVDVTAPGLSIFSTFFNDSYTTDSGTSMATPHVAGLAALLLSNEPMLIAAAVQARITNTATNIDSPNPDFEGLLGSGRIDAHAALSNTTQNHDPELSDPCVNPVSGTESTNFEFMVDYYDADGDPPDPIYRKVYISGTGGQAEGIMDLKSGSPANGTYRYARTMPIGSYSYMFMFADTRGAFDMTSWRGGPYVYSDEDAVINIVIQCTRISSDLRLEYSLTGFSGPWTDIPITKQILDPLPVPSGSTVYFQADVASPNYEYREWELYERGSRIGGGISSAWWFTLEASTTEVGLNVYYRYTPQNYTISGTVLRGDSTPVPGGVDLTLTSPEQTMLQHSTDGNFSFTGVQGGTSVTITPSADGYNFSPSSLIYHNLKDDYPGQTIVAYASDNYVPMTSFLTVPPTVSEDSSVSFSWAGEDNVTAQENLLYQYKLDGVDADWSAWISDTAISYDLENVAYVFWVRAQDEAGNINQAPISYKFVVNAAPKVTAATQINRSVWASRISLEMPASPNHPNDIFILLPEHSGTSDPELVPVAIHEIDEPNAFGANLIIAGQLGLTVRIEKAETGWLVTLPQPTPLSQTAEYDIVWGKIKYFGWQEFVSVPENFPNGGTVQSSYLNDDFRLWRLATENLQFGGSIGEHKAWVYMNVSDRHSSVVDETVLRYGPGHPFDGSIGYTIRYTYGRVLRTGSNISLYWYDLKSAWDGSNNYYYQRYGVQICDPSGSFIGDRDGVYDERSIFLPDQSIHNMLWFLESDGSTGSFFVIDYEGNERVGRTVFDTFSRSPYSSLDVSHVVAIGENALLLWYRFWDTNNWYTRREINYAIYDNTGKVVKDRTVLASVLPDTVDKNNEYSIQNVLTDDEGKVWVSYLHLQSGQPTEFYYVIIGTDGNIWKPAVQTAQGRAFSFCDKDGYVWSTEGGQFFALNPDDTVAVGPRPPSWSPSQTVGSIAASVALNGYRLYDRWTPQFIEIDVPSGVCPNSMELFDLNLWDNELHTANVNLMKGDTPVWSQSGQFTGHTTVDVSGIIDEGVNILTMTQDDFLGGQVLITFPYTIPVIGDITCDGKVNFEDILVLADQWLQPPGTPSADLAPSPLDNFVNFLDFAVFAGNWLAGVE